MSEMIERVARALCIADFNDPDRILYGAGEGYTDMLQWKYQYPAKALAAIEAMREPNNKMLHAAGKAMSPGRRPTPDRVSVNEKHRIRYQAMIEEALK